MQWRANSGGGIPSTPLISPAPKPVKVRLCLGREMPAGPTDPWMSTMGALVDGRRSRVGIRSVVAMVEDEDEGEGEGEDEMEVSD